MWHHPHRRGFPQRFIAGARAIAGRFAPSPTGKLHFGSLVSALASYLDARHRNVGWRVRVEDIDPPREVKGSAASILEDLHRLGLSPDGAVLYQSSRAPAYRRAEEKLLAEGRAFWCGCSRSELPANGVYPGTCRNGLPAGKSARALRLKVEDKEVHFVDLVQGDQSENLCESVGDFVIRRADGYPAYQLAVVVDDAFQSIDRVVRGADLLSSTARQIWLQQCLSLPTPEYAHVPLVTDGLGRKLSKQFRSDPVRDLPANQALKLALEFLGQTTCDSENTRLILEAAVANWRLARVPADAAMLPTIPGSD